MQPMTRLVVRTVLSALATMLVASILVFAALQLVPGNPAAEIAGSNATAGQVAQIAHNLGLDRPAVVRYFSWLGGVLHGDLGMSYHYHQSVWSLLQPRIGTTLMLDLYATLLVIVLGVGMGILATTVPRANGLVTFLTSSLIGLPSFVAAVLLIHVFAVNLGWFPAVGAGGPGLGSHLVSLTLPAIALSLAWTAFLGQISRASLRDQAGREHVESARGRGLSGGRGVLAAHLPQRLHPDHHRCQPDRRWSHRRLGGSREGVRDQRPRFVSRAVGYFQGHQRRAGHRDGPGRHLRGGDQHRGHGPSRARSAIAYREHKMIDATNAIANETTDAKTGKADLRGLGTRIKRSDPVILVLSAICVLFVLVAIFAPLIAPHSPTDTDILNASAPPSGDHLLGTDSTGRDIFSRLIYGTRLSLLGPAVVIAVAAVAAISLSLSAVWIGGRYDRLVGRFLNLMFSFPALILAIVVVAVTGTGLIGPAVALAIGFTPYIARVVRSVALRERHLQYIEACQTLGMSGWRICVRHLLPNLLPIIRANLTISFGSALVDLAAISYLGLGVQPPAAEWGLMVSTGQSDLIAGSPWEALSACVAIIVAVIVVNTLGERMTTRAVTR